MANIKKKTETPVVVTGPNRAVLKITIVGDEPLIVHRMSSKAQRQMNEIFEGKETVRVVRSNETREAAYEDAKYRLPDGQDAYPARNIKAAMVAAARFTKGKVSLVEAKMMFFVRGDLLPLRYERVEMVEDAVRNSNGSPDLRVRPYYYGWELDLEIEYNANVTTPDQILSLLELAGFHAGTGEWRPNAKLGTNGWAGRFQIKKKKAG